MALYARVSGEQQVKEDTIASQLEAITQRIASDGLECEPELCFVDDGYTGDILARPGLERLRDQAAAGVIDRLYVLDPDRFSRKYAYQVLILEELTRCGVEVVFLRNPPGHGPEENLLLQVQGMIAEYERAKILERCRRGKQYAARHGSVNVLSGAPYGYRYVGKHEGGGEARYQVVAEEARVVRKIFEWIGRERCSIGEVCRRLRREGVPTRTGKSAWDRSMIWLILKNPAYKGTAAFGKTRSGALKPQRLRPQRGRPEQPRRPGLTDRCIFGRSNLHRCPRVGERGTLRGGSGSTRGEPATPSRPARWRPLPSSGLGRLQAVRLRLLRQAGEPGLGQGQGPLRLLPLHGLRRLSLRRPAPLLEQADPHRYLGRRRLGRCASALVRARAGSGRVPAAAPRAGRRTRATRWSISTRLIKNLKKMISRLIDAYGDGLLDKSEFEPRILAARERLAKLEDECRQRIDEADPGGGTPAGDRPVGGVRQTRFRRNCKSRTGRRDGRSFGRW